MYPRVHVLDVGYARWFSMYCLMISSGAPSQEAAK